MNQIQKLSNEDAMRFEFLPSVWTGYLKPYKKNITSDAHELISQAMQIGRDVPKEKADKIVSDFFDGSLHDFCIKHLDRVLKKDDHKKILTKAQEIIKSNKIFQIDSKTPLLDLLAAKVALNAHDASNHMLSNACFLNQFHCLPPEGETILKRGISPVGYEDHDFFNRANEKLQEATKNAPSDRIYDSFNQWFLKYGFKCFSAFEQYGKLIHNMKNFNALIVNQAILNHHLKLRHPNTVHRPRPVNPNWRGARQ